MGTSQSQEDTFLVDQQEMKKKKKISSAITHKRK